MRIEFARVGLMSAALAVGAVSNLSICNQAEAGVASASLSLQSLVDEDLLLLGPVESLNLPESRIQILGQWVTVPSIRSSISVGELFAVYGEVASDGTYKVSAVSDLDSTPYVAGATKLFLRGVITSIKTNTGTLSIGSYSVNYAGALHTLSADTLAVGGVVSFSGLAFTESSALFADSGLVLTKPEGQVGGNAVESFGQVGGNAVRPMFGQVGGNEVRPRFGQVGGNAVETFGQVGGNAVRPTFGQVGGNEVRPRFGQVGGNAVETFGQVGGNAVRPRFGQVGGNEVRPRFGQVGGNAVETFGQVGGNAVTPKFGQVGGNAVETFGQVGGNAVARLGQVGGN